jgi:hypothetical protein
MSIVVKTTLLCHSHRPKSLSIVMVIKDDYLVDFFLPDFLCRSILNTSKFLFII